MRLVRVPVSVRPRDLLYQGSNTNLLLRGTREVDYHATSGRLYKASVPIVSRSTCQGQHGSGKVTDNMFCAGEGGQDTCTGDSGGPVIDANGYLIGITSWGYSEECANPDYSGVYTRVGKYIQWIAENI